LPKKTKNTTSSSIPQTAERLSNVKNQSATKKMSRRLIAMIFITNISFCLFSMPMAILQIIYRYRSDYSSSFYTNLSSSNSNETINEFVVSRNFSVRENNAINEMLHSIAELLQFLNHGSNFFLYSLSGQTFRKETKDMFICIYKKIFFNCKNSI